MPIQGLSREAKFDHVRHGAGFRKMERKFGRGKARKYMIARVLESERRDGRPVKPKKYGPKRKTKRKTHHRASGRR